MSKPKIILFDVDGVLIRYPHNFSEEMKRRGYPEAKKVLGEFYDITNNRIYNEGKGDMKEMIVPYLKRFGWQGTVDDFFKEQMDFSRRYLDGDLVSLAGELKKQGIGCYLASNQDKYRAQFLWEDLNLQQSFDGHFFSCEIGYKKDDDGFWEYALENISGNNSGISTWDIIYFDDARGNVEAASKFGIQSFLFTDKIQFENDMNMLGFDISLNEFSG
ncbi:MAG: hypothetical protein PHX30_02220 [Candidatus Pacebacteria bacterium]|jgi:putative hydrolase of the HAD superfamily|nr:hypothetical protein [Candidatus Paceibacterota bacterium]